MTGWVFDISNIVAPPCVDHDASSYNHSKYGRGVKTCSDSDDSNFIKKLNNAGSDDQHGHHKEK